jgi:hypothetical protein
MRGGQTRARKVEAMETTDETPTFPHYAAELRRRIGIPDHPAIHLAISIVADRLMPAAAIANTDPELQRIEAVRTASLAVLFSWPIEWAENYVSGRGPSPPHEVWWPEEVFGVKATDWLGLAIDKLRTEGIDAEPDPRRTKTRYGWDKGALSRE